MPIDKDALAASLRRLADPRAADGDLISTLTEVTKACVGLFGVTGSGIMLADEQNIARYVAASDGPGSVLEILESEAGDGPCMRAFVHNTVCPVTDVTTDPRWPKLAAAIAPYPVRAVLGVPVRLGAVTVGTLDVYRDRPHIWDESEQTALQHYSDVVETTLTAALAAHKAQEIAGQLQYALDYRVVIERGVGYLMAQDRIDAVTAFNRLRSAARTSRSRIGDVAAQLLETGELPTNV